MMKHTCLLVLAAVGVNTNKTKGIRKFGSLQLANHQFTYSEILDMTNNFERVIGRGGFGTVYHGYLNNIQVAVKMLSESSSQGYKEFQAEVSAGFFPSLQKYFVWVFWFGLIISFRLNFWWEFTIETWQVLLGIARKTVTWGSYTNTWLMETYRGISQVHSFTWN